MRKLFYKYPEPVLIALAAVLAVILGAYYFWGVRTLLADFNQAISVGGEKQPQIEFDIDGAASLGLEGPAR